MLANLKSILHRDCEIETDQSVLVGVSGGVDSLCLLDGLHRLGINLIVAHFDHGLRSNSAADLEFVRTEALKRGSQFFGERADTAAFAHEKRLSIEAAGRELRYSFLFRVAAENGVRAVATAHNADDQVETVLMHLIRGAGLDGLTGMAVRSVPNSWSNSIPLLRPLLGIWRLEIETYCAENNLIFIDDHTNRDLRFFRNRLRHELIPGLESAFDPGFRPRLWQTANLLAADRQVLENLTTQTWEKEFYAVNADGLAFTRAAFNQHPLGLRRRLIRKAIAKLQPGARDVDYAIVHRVIDFCASPPATHQMDIGLGIWLFSEAEAIFMTMNPDQLPAQQWPQMGAEMSGVRVTVAGSEVRLVFEAGWQLTGNKIVDIDHRVASALQNGDEFQVWFDAGEANPEIEVRTRQPGDRFKPLGLNGKSMKLSDFMINEKISARARDRWPLVCLGSDIVWVPGYRLAHPYRVTGDSKHVFQLRVSNKK